VGKSEKINPLVLQLFVGMTFKGWARYTEKTRGGDEYSENLSADSDREVDDPSKPKRFFKSSRTIKT